MSKANLAASDNGRNREDLYSSRPFEAVVRVSVGQASRWGLCLTTLALALEGDGGALDRILDDPKATREAINMLRICVREIRDQVASSAVEQEREDRLAAKADTIFIFKCPLGGAPHAFRDLEAARKKATQLLATMRPDRGANAVDIRFLNLRHGTEGLAWRVDR